MAILDGGGMPPEFDGVVDTSDYVPDEKAIKAAMEKNRALINKVDLANAARVKSKVLESVLFSTNADYFLRQPHHPEREVYRRCDSCTGTACSPPRFVTHERGHFLQ